MVDLTAKFLAFYDSAKVLDADAEQRWTLWGRLVGFAAVPPGEFTAHAHGHELSRHRDHASVGVFADRQPSD